jgi:hypothetical protein
MNTYKALLSLVLILLIVNLTEQRRKTKSKEKKPKKKENPLDKRPEKVKPELYCDACQAIIKEATKELRGKKKESDVMDYLDHVCNPEKYYTYSHPPPEMREGCEAFVNGWEEQIEKVLINRPDDETPIRKLCYEISKACEGVDPTNVKPFDDQIMMDGQPKKIKDGKIQGDDDEDL